MDRFLTVSFLDVYIVYSRLLCPIWPSPGNGWTILIEQSWLKMLRSKIEWVSDESEKMRIWTFHLWVNWFNQGPLSTFEILKLILFGDNELVKLVKHELRLSIQNVALDMQTAGYTSSWICKQLDTQAAGLQNLLKWSRLRSNGASFAFQLLVDQPIKHLQSFSKIWYYWALVKKFKN